MTRSGVRAGARHDAFDDSLVSLWRGCESQVRQRDVRQWTAIMCSQRGQSQQAPDKGALELVCTFSVWFDHAYKKCLPPDTKTSDSAISNSVQVLRPFYPACTRFRSTLCWNRQASSCSIVHTSAVHGIACGSASSSRTFCEQSNSSPRTPSALMSAQVRR